MKQLTKIKLVISDVDGVLTDGGLYYNEKGEELKKFHVKDGLGIKMLLATGIKVAILSGGDSPLLRKRIEVLKIPYFLLGKMEKRTACLTLIEEAGVTPEETAYIGDDTLDLPAFEVCGLSVAVGDAPEYIQKQADLILKKEGGQGAFRELSDMLLLSQGKEEVYSSAEGFMKVVDQMAQ
ncbi:HAD-IIIA family hydrolase [Pasteurella skyensis]|uniref:3-deoxy-D-manno-octulosonate 8-phosphate phosphatase KdsC n=1 Tax=Phocoenobacter skyensis TaxID=97481 RepID=A0AAJ6N976_9PAST|nr:HAD-IIIA family hydrolase [Pasteurella skyensis]MDP8162886.1 HAD-IIIA family hydrolase [Pasteurella skyensis]MDP8172527.1 HAD-IIIA family hydrolase [Pasteurella skyensis]MDP8177710.1 HAD-IIIA family hydrolase [Pasteurella skyensis]MDP8179027.1 HAD-IIIA family hydrolase [Pasteurella skyensis]MDP8183288.1 HAD-IIIA family hydrolase [Pasteurella skyensis]